MFHLRQVLAFVLSICLLASSVMALDYKTITLQVTDKVIGKTMAYLGPSNITRGPTEEATEKYIKDSGFNTTKFWLSTGNYEQLAARQELYGPKTKEIAVRQVSEHPEKIDWDLELQKSDLEPHFDICKRLGIQPVLQMIAPFASHDTGSVEPLVQQVFWRRVFLYCYWANMIKKYNFILWSMGSENPVDAGIMQAEVGSDAVREAEKLTGVKVKLSAPGDDWTIQEIIDGFEGILKVKTTADRLDGLSFQSFNFFSTFPKQSDYPTYLEQLRVFDQLQHKYRPGKPLLPYWDTSWFWRTKPGGAGYQSDYYITGTQYISRLIWGNMGGVVVSTPYTMYGAESDSLYGRGLGGVIKVDQETKETRPGRGYFALRMMARATVGGKERLEILGLPDGNDVLALASRDSTHFYFTIVNRCEKTEYRLRLTITPGLENKVYSIREFSEMLRDEQMSRITLPVIIQIEPLAAIQLVTELK
ncbi:MAG TPA: hypothetical protein VM123_11545 [archaeon]|nr:hypothetical protein [archaeon]